MLLLAAAAFVGSQACRPCHAAVVDEYLRTPMARSAGRVEPFAPVRFTAAGHSYRIEGTRLIFDGGEAPFSYYIGSNAAGRTFLSERDGFLFELPVTWYAQQRRWDASPGYDREPRIRLNRAVEPSCLWCHSSRVRPVLGTQNRYGDPPFLEGGVACERCHGPGGDHVRDPAHAPLVNPAKLDPARRDAICSQCHLTGEARVERPGRRFVEYQAGDRLTDYVTYFAFAGGRDDLKVTSHVEKLAESACKRASGDALWCGDCHDVHNDLAAGASRTQAACTGCHSQAHHAQQQCASCHMPKSRMSGGGHGVFTDHSIPRVPRSVATSEPAGRSLIAFLGSADDRSLGLAYASIGDARARELLLRATPQDAEVRLHLAALEPDQNRAASLYEAVLKASPGQTVALVNLGAIYARAGHTTEAAELWARALETNPGLEEAALNLAQIQPAAEARRTILRYLEFNPTSSAARSRLGSLP